MHAGIIWHACMHVALHDLIFTHGSFACMHVYSSALYSYPPKYIYTYANSLYIRL